MNWRLIRSIATVVFCVVIMGYSMRVGIKNHTKLDYMAHLNDVVAVIDNEELTLEELLFYVTYQENKVEHDARIYNPENSRDYWNIHTNGSFIKEEAKDVVIGMAIHDRIFFKMARENNTVLTTEERQNREDTRSDFWSDLYPEQREIVSGHSEALDIAIDRIALAEKAQREAAEADGVGFSQYNWAAKEFLENIKSKHDVKIIEDIWDHIVLGDITLIHDKVSYTPFLKSEEKEDEDRQK
ncbi:MAG: hypothetical protein K6F00_01555 [Lachnospiraceae bacterium]|nr:hypothetical protein [Lachnospiraceae bacterium]